MSHHDDRTPGGPDMGDRAFQRALAAAMAADQAGVPDPVADREKERERVKAAVKAGKLEFARRCTEQVKGILGSDIKLKPGDWSVEFTAPGNSDSGSGFSKSLASVALNGVYIYAREVHDDSPVLWISVDNQELTREVFGRALRRVQG